MRMICCVGSVFWGLGIDFSIKMSWLYALYWVELSAFRMPLKLMFNSTHLFKRCQFGNSQSEWNCIVHSGMLHLDVPCELMYDRSSVGESLFRNRLAMVSTGLNIVVQGGTYSSLSANCTALAAAHKCKELNLFNQNNMTLPRGPLCWNQPLMWEILSWLLVKFLYLPLFMDSVPFL